MAKIQFGPLVTGLRGTIAGTTFSANRTGPYAKSWSRSAVSQTPAASLQRFNLGLIPPAWRAMSAALRADWDTWAALPAQELFDPFGIGYYIPGAAWFTKINRWRQANAMAILTTVPTLAAGAAGAFPTVILQSGGAPECSANFAASWAGAGMAYCYAIRLPNAATLSTAPTLFVAAMVPAPYGTKTVFTSAFVAVFGDITASCTYRFRFFGLSTEGYRGSYVQAAVTAT